jgi:proteic killer suppression protein
LIESFASPDAERIFNGEFSRHLDSIKGVAFRKLAMLHSAKSLADLRVPPGNCLEALKGDRAGQHSIRINKQFRVCFTWRNGSAHNVEIVDFTKEVTVCQ